MVALIASIVTILGIGLKIGIYFYKKNRKKPTYDEDIQNFHNSMAKGNADDISLLFDELRKPPGTRHNVRNDSQETP